MQFDDAGTIRVPVRWYFTKPGAKHFDYGHLYTSSNWLTVPQQTVGPGERWDAVRTYDKGQAPALANGTGPPCGPQDWWQNGVPTGAPPLKLGPTGIGLCCNPSIGGGLLLGGGRSVPCVQALAGYTLECWTSLTPTFQVMTPFTATVWRLEVSFNAFVKVQGGVNTGSSGQGCLGVNQDVFFGSQERIGGATFISYDPGSGTSTYVLQPSFPALPLDGVVVQIRVLNRTYKGLGGLLLGGEGVTNPIFKDGAGGLLLGGGGALAFIVAGEGGLLLGGEGTPSVPQEGEGGLLLGGLSRPVIARPGEGGLLLGGEGTGHASTAGEGGLLLGGEGGLLERVAGEGGLLLGGEGGLLERVAGEGGLLLGEAAVRRLSYAGKGGLKLGNAGSEKFTSTTEGGLKIGGSSANTSGLLFQCCPGQVFPTTVFGQTSGGTKFPLAWDSTNSWYQGLANNPAETVRLACTFTGGVWKWVMSAVVQFGCSYSYTQTSLTCGPPFALVISQHVTGGSCVIFGTWSFTFTTT